MIPISYDENGNLEEVVNAYNPFMRGVMEFDDYNYAVHNPYILVEDPKLAAEEEAVATGKKNLVSEEEPMTTRTTKQMGGLGGDLIISEKNLNNLVSDDYTHGLLTIEPSEM